jgi:hypothetical protein
MNFSAFDFNTIRRAIIEYMQTYFPNDFNDYTASNGYMMLVEICAQLISAMALRSDIVAEDGTLATANTTEAAINHLALINQKFMRQTPASVDIMCGVTTPILTDVTINAGLTFSILGDDGSPVYYELYRAPGDFTSPIIIPAGKAGVVAFGIEGKTASYSTQSDGVANQVVSVTGVSILEAPITVIVGGTTWQQVDFVEKYLASDTVYSAQVFDDRMDISFGDNINGVIPILGSTINVGYRQGGGVRGRIGAGIISQSRPVSPGQPYTAPIAVTFTNIAASVGGSNEETLDQAKNRAPREAATHYSATTEGDYGQLASTFSHPVFGAVAKAIATVRTSIKANVVDIFVLSVDASNRPVSPSAGLTTALQNYLTDINVATDSVFVHSGSTYPINLTLNVIVHSTADASIVKGKIEAAISNFFDINNWSLGQAFYIAQLYNTLMAVDGVAYVDILSPTDNILSTGALTSGLESGQIGISLDQLIVLANSEVSYYYEK